MLAYIATRKGLIEINTSDLADPVKACHFEAEPVTIALHDPRDDTLYAGLRHGHFGVKLHRSEDRGASWQEISAPAFEAVLEEVAPADAAEQAPAPEGEADAATSSGPSVDMIWALVAGGDDQPGRLWAGTLPGALFRSDDRGTSWQLVESLWQVPERSEWFGGGYDVPGIHSILIDPADSRCLTVGVSCGGVWHSRDDGISWQLGGEGLRADFMPPGQEYHKPIQDPHLLAHCRDQPKRMWCQHHNGIFRSDDGGCTFTEVTTVSPAFGFPVAVHPTRPDTAWFVPAVKDEHRVPENLRMVVSRTQDGGATFEMLDRGLPARSFDLVYRHALAVDHTGDQLMMGSTTGNLWHSTDGGESWSLVSSFLPPVYQVLII